jgi:hypothetical protein
LPETSSRWANSSRSCDCAAYYAKHRVWNTIQFTSTSRCPNASRRRLCHSRSSGCLASQRFSAGVHAAKPIATRNMRGRDGRPSSERPTDLPGFLLTDPLRFMTVRFFMIKPLGKRACPPSRTLGKLCSRRRPAAPTARCSLKEPNIVRLPTGRTGVGMPITAANLLGRMPIRPVRTALPTDTELAPGRRSIPPSRQSHDPNDDLGPRPTYFVAAIPDTFSRMRQSSALSVQK